MDDETEALTKLATKMKFDKMIVLGVREDAEEMHFMMSGNISEPEAMLILCDAMADMTVTLFPPPAIH